MVRTGRERNENTRTCGKDNLRLQVNRIYKLKIF